MDRRTLKVHVFTCLGMEDVQAMEEALCLLPGRRAIGPLMGAFCHGEEGVRWHAIRGLGAVCQQLYEKDPEGVRWVMRRLIWMLNDESGGIGWGCGEAMGEIMARIPPMAHEYHRILSSYLDPEGNYLENPLLQRGVLWGLARLGQASPVFVRDMRPLLCHYLQKNEPEILVPALFLARFLGNGAYSGEILSHVNDTRQLSFYWDGRFMPLEIGRLAAGVLESGGNGVGSG